MSLLPLLLLAAAPAPMQLTVDLTEAPRRLFHAELKLPVTAGPLTLVYPKWIPGEHAPSGPLTDLTVTFLAGGKQLPWHRDAEDLHAFSLEIPAGVTELDAQLTFISAPSSVSSFSGGGSATANLALLSWNHVVLSPKGMAASAVQLKPSLKLPTGWKWASALTAKGTAAQGVVSFEPVSLETLIDSPVLTGLYLQTTPLGTLRGAPVSFAVAAETPAEAHLAPEDKTALERLVKEEAALYGARHFDHYVFLLTASDQVGSFGLEHHQSSDDRLPGRVLIDHEIGTSRLVPLLAHESTHSWNGKFRRPAGLLSADYQAPMHGELLWVYEGLTQYLGHVLAGRSKAWDAPTVRDSLALTAEAQRQARGRTWRPLEDTATAAQLLYAARPDWASLRRGVDFYDEGDLLWLEVDATLRQLTHGQKSLDDFVQAFHGGADSGPQVKPYELQEVLAGLQALAPFDWKGLFDARVRAFTGDAPLQGLEKAGWRLGYTDKEPALQKALEKVAKHLDLGASLGLVLETEKGAIVDVVPGSPADKAGLAPSMVLVAVNSRKWTPERLLTALEQTKSGAPLVLLVENAETYRSFTVEYKLGLRYPTLERITGTPDLLEEIFKPHAAL